MPVSRNDRPRRCSTGEAELEGASATVDHRRDHDVCGEDAHPAP